VHLKSNLQYNQIKREIEEYGGVGFYGLHIKEDSPIHIRFAHQNYR